MDLATHQRQLLGLIKSTYQPTVQDDPYIRMVAQSERLKVMREIVVFWRAVGLERYCILTATLLKRRGLFDQAVEDLVRTQELSPFVEKLSRTFVEMLSTHDDSLIASVAQFESAFIKVKHGDPACYVVDWDYEPHTVLACLLRNLPLDEAHIQGQYQTVISAQIPATFEVRAR